MNDEIIFDTMFTGDEYLALPSDVQNECVKVACYSSGQAGMRVRCADGTNGKVVWRGAHLYPYRLTGNKNWYAHRSQHPARMSASGFVVRGALDERAERIEITDRAFIDILTWIDTDEGRAAGQYGWLKVNGNTQLQVGFHHALPGWANHTVGTYYTKKLTMVKPYMVEASLEVTDRMHQLLRMYYPRVVHPLGFAWVSEVRYNPRKKRVEAKVLNERWLSVVQPGLDDESVMMLVSRSRIVQWDATMLQRPQHVTGETFA